MMANGPIDVETLVDESVLSIDGDDVRLAPDFHGRVQTLLGGDHDALLDAATALASESVGSELTSVASFDARSVAEFVALSEETALDQRERLGTLALLGYFEHGEPVSHGSPASFVSVHGVRLPWYLTLSRNALVYVWRNECPPCDATRASLDDLFADGDADLARLSVFGPNFAEFLRDRYGVQGGPTVLYVLDGAVDARVQGHSEPVVLETELEKHLSIIRPDRR